LGKSQCPYCSVLISPFWMDDIEVNICQSCNGIWFDRGELSQSLGIDIPGAKGFDGTINGELTEYVCPACESELCERQLGSFHEVLYLECPECNGAWLDKNTWNKARSCVAAHKGQPDPVVTAAAVPAKGPIEVDLNHNGITILQCITGLPIETGVEKRIFAPVVTGLIIVNFLVLVIAKLFGPTHNWVMTLGVIPANITSGENLHTLFTSMFMHGGWMHLLGNMYFLWIVGDALETRMGKAGFLLFYLGAGVFSAFIHVIAEVGSACGNTMPVIGASGAISGAMGAYTLLYPANRFMIRILFFFRFEIPVWVYFGFWILLQMVYASMHIKGVSWYSHIGGFFCGVATGAIIRIFSVRKPVGAQAVIA